ncbi:hypothetical protein Ancab_023693 [Ancistrocladus abbreviatus]
MLLWVLFLVVVESGFGGVIIGLYRTGGTDWTPGETSVSPDLKNDKERFGDQGFALLLVHKSLFCFVVVALLLVRGMQSP